MTTIGCFLFSGPTSDQTLSAMGVIKTGTFLSPGVYAWDDVQLNPGVRFTGLVAVL